MIPIPVNVGLYLSSNGIVIPRRPGFSHWSPSNASPCTAIAPSRRERDVLVQTRARLPQARPPERLGRHRQPEHDRKPRSARARRRPRRRSPATIDIAAADARPSGEQRVHGALVDLARRRSRSPRPRRSSCTITPPCSASTPRAPSGPSSNAIFDSVSASSARVAERGRADQTTPDRRSGARVQQMVRVAAVGAAPDADVEAGRRDPATTRP